MNPTAQVQNSIFDLISTAGPMAKLVLVLLLAASVFCWAVIFTKWRTLKQARAENADFLEVENSQAGPRRERRLS